ncbi:MAG TPA: DUF3375 family protein [Campylobacterales bacterium]|nr:DUF3375 family protein [Campylobacterales bacterium]
MKEDIVEVDLTKLYTQVYVDETLLRENIKKLLQQKSQFTLQELNQEIPIKKGISEVVVYLKLAQNIKNAYIQESKKDSFVIEDEYGDTKKIIMDRVVFVREG